MHKKSRSKQYLSDNQVKKYTTEINELSSVALKVTGAVSSSRKNNFFLNLLMLFFFNCGILSTLNIIKNFTAISYNEIFLYVFLFVFSLVLWVLSQFKKTKPWHLISAGMVLSVFTFLIYSQKIFTQINIIIGLSVWSPGFIDLVDITHTVLIISMLLTAVFYVLTFCVGKGWLLVLASVPFIVMSPIFEIEIRLADLFLLGLFFVGSYTVGNVHNPSKRKKQKVNRLTVSQRMSISGSGTAIILSLFLIFSFLAYSFASPRMEKLYEIPMSVESIAQQAISSLINAQPDNGNINKGNNISFGQKHLEVTTSKKPESALYLKNYTGGYYNNGRWNTVNENSFFSNTQEPEEYAKVYNNPYYILQYAYDETEQTTIKVRSLKSLVTGNCVPLLSDQIGNENGFTVYQSLQMSQLAESINNGYLLFDNAIFSEYSEYVENTYKYIPTDRIPRLIEFTGNSLVSYGDYEEATDFILQTFDEMTTYTTTPGNAPSNIDISEYFLFDNQKGYCQHYATTAALMYRLLGLPSRYVTGYMATPGEFSKNSDGTYTAILKDENAHAWVEVYVQNAGWIPTEVTLTNNELSQGNSDSDSSTEQQEETTENTQPTGNSDITENTTSPDDFTDETKPNNERGNAETNIFVQTLKILLYIIIAAAIIFAVIYIFKIRRKKKLASLKKLKPNILFIKSVEMLHLAGYLKEYKGIEEDYAEKLTKTIKNLNIAEAKKFVHLANKSAFGNKPADKNERQEAFEFYKITADFVYEKINIFKKLYFKYIKVYY